ncbi:hypothetical protein Adt_41932 [Abeliophyllum distichum]|uniref:Uncharacterized protein n=1 Tax=Abeliophyllum distichum TaxID=126358 RepID=A0ABD1PQ94_9LAMI
MIHLPGTFDGCTCEEAHQKKTIEEIDREAVHKKGRRLVLRTGDEDGDEEEVASLVKKPRVGISGPQKIEDPGRRLPLAYSVENSEERKVARGSTKEKKRETRSEDNTGHVGLKDVVASASETLQRTQSVTATEVVMLGDAPLRTKGKGKRKEKVVMNLASFAGEQDTSPRDTCGGCLRRLLERLGRGFPTKP